MAGQHEMLAKLNAMSVSVTPDQNCVTTALPGNQLLLLDAPEFTVCISRVAWRAASV